MENTDCTYEGGGGELNERGLSGFSGLSTLSCLSDNFGSFENDAEGLEDLRRSYNESSGSAAKAIEVLRADAVELESTCRLLVREGVLDDGCSTGLVGTDEPGGEVIKRS